MQYVMMVYLEDERWAKLAGTEAETSVNRELWRWYQGLVQSGQIVNAGRLKPAATARTVRETNGRSVVTDGPFAETKEVLGGFHLLECRDRDEAVAIAKTFPGLNVDGTSIELREVMTDEEESQRWRTA